MAGESTFHVVCRDCQTERVVDSESTAIELADRHHDETGAEHDVEFQRIA